MAHFPESYADPVYDRIDAANEAKLGIPVGLLTSIRTAGEKTNASRVSSAGAVTPYQFIPSTSAAILDKYGIDVTLSPENASEGAGLLLRDSLKRAGGDVETAVREYHGGTNRDNWGPVNNAYAGRVLAKHQAVKTGALEAGFAKFMAANPAAPTPAAPKAEQPDPLADGFGAWMKAQNAPAPEPASNQIPATPNFDGTMPAPLAPQAPAADPTVVQKILGGGEAALTLATGATTGAVGMLDGAAAGLIGNLTGGKYGNPEGVEAGMAQGMAMQTYQPRSDAGQEYADTIGKVAQSLPAVSGLGMEMSAAARGAGTLTRGAVDASAAGVQRIRSAVPAIAERVQRTITRNPDRATPTPGTRASGGSAGTDIADQRRQLAADLPVPIKLTRGQAERTFEQQRFEKEMAKDPVNGEPLRDRYAQQNEDIMKNFDAWVDQTGAEAPNLRATGEAVDKALVAKAARDKAEVRVAYKNAEKAGEMEDPVTLNSLVDHLNESAPDVATAPLLDVARKRAVQLGIAVEGENGQLAAAPVTLKTAETMRQAIGRATDYEATNIRQSAIIKGLIDTETEGAGGAAYQAARRTRENFAKQYEDRAVIASLLNKKRGTSDRKVALEDVWDHAIIKGSLDDVRHVRRVLQTGGEEGQQAWRELQGQTINWIKEEATKNVATDTRGNAIVSADKLAKAIRAIDADGKMEFLFGKKGAQQLRDINDLTKAVYTAPPGSVNTSNTASVLMAALAEAGVTGGMTGLPVPVLSGLRLISMHVKNRKIQQRIEQALNHQNGGLRAPPPAPPIDRTLH